jgi:hypothetical protein
MYVKQNTGSLLWRLFLPLLFCPPPSLDHHLSRLSLPLSSPSHPSTPPRPHNGPILAYTRRLCPYSYRYLCSPLKSTVLNPQILQRTVSLRLPLLVYLMRLRAGIYAHV